MVDQPNDRPDAKRPQIGEPLAWPGPVCRGNAIRRCAFPQHGVTECTQSERGKAVQITSAPGMAALLDLIEVSIANTVNGWLEAAPYFQRRSSDTRPAHEADSATIVLPFR